MARKKRRNNPLKIFIIGVFLTIFGAGLTLFRTYPAYKLAKESYNWPQTKGQISKSQVKQRRGGKKNKIQYWAYISYDYEIDGKQYSSSKIHAGLNGSPMSSDSSHAYNQTYKYPVGKKVAVFFSKKNKENAVLEPGVHTRHYIGLGGTIICAIVGFFMSLASLRKVLGVLVFVSKSFAFITTLFGKKRRSYGQSHLEPRAQRKKRIPAKEKVISSKATYSNESINLDAEMSQFNKVSSSSSESSESPWLYKWYIKGQKKNYGPYTFEKILDYYKRGKVKGNHQCYSSKDAEVIKISSIVDRKKAG